MQTDRHVCQIAGSVGDQIHGGHKLQSGDGASGEGFVGFVVGVVAVLVLAYLEISHHLNHCVPST